MPEYEITRWDAVIPKNNTFPYPMVYIKPDDNFIEYARKNNFLFLLDIDGTEMDYDKRSVMGMIDSSGYFPDFRPNFFNETGYYVITLFTNWIGYPKNNGKIKLNNIEIHKAIPSEIHKPTFPEYYESPNTSNDGKCGKLNSTQLGWLLTSILIVFCVLLAISFRKKII